MAYLAFDDTGLAPLESRAEHRAENRAAPSAPVPDPAIPAARLSALEWAVVALARRDTPATLRRPGRLAVAMRAVFRQPNPRLADERLEALRRIAVLSWRHGYTVPSREVTGFLDAGFTPDQYELLLASIATARQRERRV